MTPEKKLVFAVQPGDARHAALCRLLDRDGHSAGLIDLTVPQNAEALPRGSVAVVAASSHPAAPALGRAGVWMAAYQDDPACVLAHAGITAENALAVAMESLETTLADRAILVIGHGRIGHALAGKLRGLGCRVVVSARRPEDEAAIVMAGHRALETDHLESALAGFDLIFNTVPARVLPENRLARLGPETLIIDLASMPGGVDFKAAEAMGLRAIHALALPGRRTPLSSARVIRDTVYRILSKEGVL